MSDLNSIELKSAIPDDSGVASELIYSTGTDFFNFLFFNNKERILFLLRELFKKNRGIFSYKFSTVAKNGDNILGLELGYGRNKQELNTLINGIYIVLRSSPEKTFSILIRDYIISHFFRKIFKNSYYIAHLAVKNEYRHHGVGGLLLKNTFTKARELGFSHCSLDVSINNEEALKLYKENGFKIIEEIRFPVLEKKYKLPGQLRMLKKIK